MKEIKFALLLACLYGLVSLAKEPLNHSNKQLATNRIQQILYTN